MALKIACTMAASPPPQKGHSPCRKMEGAWEKGMSALHGAHEQERLNVPAPTRDGFYAFLQRGQLATYINSAHSVFIAMQRLGGAVLYASVCMVLASYRLKLIPRDRPLTGRAKNFLGRALVPLWQTPVCSDKALSEISHSQGHPRVLYSLAPRGLFLPFPEYWVWSMGLESRLITDGKWTLAFSLIPRDGLVREAGEAQTSQLLPRPRLLEPGGLTTRPIPLSRHQATYCPRDGLCWSFDLQRTF